MAKRHVYFISDSTGLTVEQLGRALLTQFPNIHFDALTMRFVDSRKKAQAAVRRVQRRSDGDPNPILLLSIVDQAVRSVFDAASGTVIDMLGTMISPLEQALGQAAEPIIGGAHTARNAERYGRRIEAVEFALAHDDGLLPKDLEHAQLILVGVSRSGKTPTSLYLALQFGLPVANYPLLPEDLETDALPARLAPYRDKLFGLSLSPERLSALRQMRRPNSQYAQLAACRSELRSALALYKREGIPYIDTSARSVEEIATEILARSER